MHLSTLQTCILLIFGLGYFRQKVNWKKLRAEDGRIVMREFLEGFLPAAGIIGCMALGWLVPMLLVIAIEMIYHAWRYRGTDDMPMAIFGASISFLVYGAASTICFFLVAAVPSILAQ